MGKPYASVLLLVLLIFSSIAEGHAKYQYSQARLHRQARKRHSSSQHSMSPKDQYHNLETEYESLLSREAFPTIDELLRKDWPDYLTPDILTDTELQTTSRTGVFGWLLDWGGALLGWMVEAGRAVVGWAVKGFEKLKEIYQDFASTRVGQILISIFKELFLGGLAALQGNTARILINPLLSLIKGLCETFGWGDLKIGDFTIVQIIETIQDIVGNPTGWAMNKIKEYGAKILAWLGFEIDKFLPDGVKDMLASAATALGSVDVTAVLSSGDLAGAALQYLKGAATQYLKGLGVSAWLDIILQKFFKEVAGRFMGFVGTGVGQVILSILEDLRTGKFDTIQQLSKDVFTMIEDKMSGVSWAEMKIWGWSIKDIVAKVNQGRAIIEAVMTKDFRTIFSEFLKYRHLLPGIDIIETSLRDLAWKQFQTLKTRFPMIAEIEGLAKNQVWDELYKLKDKYFPNLDMLKEFAIKQFFQVLSKVEGVSPVLASIKDMESLLKNQVIEPFNKFASLVMNIKKIEKLSRAELLDRLQGVKFLFTSWKTASREELIEQIKAISDKLPFIVNYQELVKNFLFEKFSTLVNTFPLLASLQTIVKTRITKEIDRLKAILDVSKLTALSNEAFLNAVGAVKHLLPSLRDYDIITHVREEIIEQIKKDTVVLDTISMIESLLSQNHWEDISKLIELVPKIPKLEGLAKDKILAQANEFKDIIPAFKNLANLKIEEVTKELLQLQKVFVTITGLQDLVKTRILKEFGKIQTLISNVKNMKGGILDHIFATQIAQVKALIPQNLMPALESLSITETIQKLQAFKNSLPSLDDIRLITIEKLFEHFQGLREVKDKLADVTKMKKEDLADALDKVRSFLPAIKLDNIAALERTALEAMAGTMKDLIPKVLVLEDLIKSQFLDYLGKFKSLIADIPNIEKLDRAQLIVRLEPVKNILPNIKNLDITTLEKTDLLGLVKNEIDMLELINMAYGWIEKLQFNNLIELVLLSTRKLEELDETKLKEQLTLLNFLPDVKKLTIDTMKKEAVLAELKSVMTLAKNAHDLLELIKKEVWSKFMAVTNLINKVQGFADRISSFKDLVPGLDILKLPPDQIAVKLGESLTKLPSLKELQELAIGKVWEQFVALRDFITKIPTLKDMSKEQILTEVSKVQLMLPGVKIGQLTATSEAEILAAVGKIQDLVNRVMDFQNRIRDSIWRMFNKYIGILTDISNLQALDEKKLAGLLKKVSFLLPAGMELETLTKEAITKKLNSFKELIPTIPNLDALLKGELWNQAQSLVTMIGDISSVEKLADDKLLLQFDKVAALLPFDLKLVKLTEVKAKILAKIQEVKSLIPDMSQLQALAQKVLMEQFGKFGEIIANLDNLQQLAQEELIQRLESIRALLPFGKDIKLEKYTKEELLTFIKDVQKYIPNFNDIQKSVLDVIYNQFAGVKDEVYKAINKELLKDVKEYKAMLSKVKFLMPITFDWEKATLKEYQAEAEKLKNILYYTEDLQSLCKGIFEAQFKNLEQMAEQMKARALNYLQDLAKKVFSELKIDKAISLFNFLSEMSSALSDPSDIIANLEKKSESGTYNAIYYLLKRAPTEPPAFKSNVELIVDARRISAYYQTFLKSPIGQMVAVLLSDISKDNRDSDYNLPDAIVNQITGAIKGSKWEKLRFTSWSLKELLIKLKDQKSISEKTAEKILNDMGFKEPIVGFQEWILTVFQTRMYNGKRAVKNAPWDYVTKLINNEMAKGNFPKMLAPLYTVLAEGANQKITEQGLKVINTRVGRLFFYILNCLAVHANYPDILSTTNLTPGLEGLLAASNMAQSKIGSATLADWAKLFGKGKEISKEEIENVKKALTAIGVTNYAALDVSTYKFFNSYEEEIKEACTTTAKDVGESKILRAIIALETAYSKMGSTYLAVRPKDKRLKRLIRSRLGQVIAAALTEVEKETQNVKGLQGKDGLFDKLLAFAKSYDIDQVVIDVVTLQVTLEMLRDGKDATEVAKRTLSAMQIKEDRTALTTYLDTAAGTSQTTLTERAVAFIEKESEYYVTARKKYSHLLRKQHETIELESKFGQLSLAVLSTVVKSNNGKDDEWKVLGQLIKLPDTVKEILKLVSDHGAGRVSVGMLTMSEMLGKIFSVMTADEHPALKKEVVAALQNLGYSVDSGLPKALNELFAQADDEDTRDYMKENRLEKAIYRFIDTDVSATLPYAAGRSIADLNFFKAYLTSK